MGWRTGGRAFANRTLAVTVAVVLAGVLLGSAPIAPALAAPGGWSATGTLQGTRSSQTATRLPGGKVLVAGGVRAGQALASAELYDPSSGAWSVATALTGARSSHTATALPDGRVVVVGGTGSDGKPLASTEIYNPRTATWNASGPLSAARSSHSATLLSSGQILVAGGVGSDGKPLASAEVYNPTTGTWSATTPPSTARSAHTASLLRDGKVLVVGGTGLDGRPLPSAELYDSATGAWTVTGSLSTARSGQTATPLGGEASGGADPRVLVAGGTGPDGNRQTSVELYDPRTGAWTSSTAALRVGRSSHTATLLPSGLVLVAGGTATDPSAELYDPATDRWSPTGAPAGVRSGHTATVLLSGGVLVTGGAGSGDGALGSAELYEPDLGERWQPTGPLQVARSGHAATLLEDGDVLVAGGHRTTTAVTPPRIIDPLTSVELYHPASGTWTAVGSLGRARSFQTATVLRGSAAQCADNCGKVLIAGGVGADSTGRAQTVSSAELYDPATKTFRATGSMTTARALQSATLLSSGKVLVVAGAGPGGAEPRNANQLASAELYDPVTETWTATGSLTGTTTPPASNTPRGARFGHTAVLLDRGACGANCGKVLVAGGVGGVGTGPALSSAELYDPGTGTFTATASLGQARQSQAGSLLPNGKVLVAGGIGGFSTAPPNLDSGEIYDPGAESWSAPGSPAARRIAQTATPLNDGRVLFVGGVGGGNATGASNTPGPGLFSTETFDSEANAWSRASSLNTARVYHTATLLPSGPASVCGESCGKVLVAGGNAELIGTFAPYFDLQSPLSSAELYTPAQPSPGPSPSPDMGPGPAPRPRPNPIGTQVKDMSAPLVNLGGKLAQSIRRGYVYVDVRTDEDASLSASGTVARPTLRATKSAMAAAKAKPKRSRSKVYKLAAVKATVKARKKLVLKLRLTKKAIRGVKEGLRRGRRSTARVRILATDASGNTRLVKRQIRIKD